MKVLTMTKHQDKKNGFIYRVLDEEGNTIAARSSGRNYIACYIIPDNTRGVDKRLLKYRICNCFSRLDLIGKGDSAQVKPYAAAYLEGFKIWPENFL